MADRIDVIKEAGKAVARLNTERERIEKLLLDGVEKALTVIEADGKRNCPVDDGRLRASITHAVEATPEQARGRVGTNVDYAPYVHEGTGIYARNGNGRKKPWVYTDSKTGERIFTHGQKPQPFLRDAMEQNRDRIAQIMKEATNKL